MKGDVRKTTLPPRLTIHNKNPMYAVYLANIHKISGISAELQQINATGFDN